MVVDDDPFIRVAISSALTAAGFDVVDCVASAKTETADSELTRCSMFLLQLRAKAMKIESGAKQKIAPYAFIAPSPIWLALKAE